MTPIRLLIADDSVVSRQMLKTCLSSVAELEVVAVANNGRFALEKIARYQPDLVILDFEMPEMDGLETLREIRKLYGRLPVIMFSAMTESGAEITIKALSLGADDYVTKPSTRDRQQHEVREYIINAFLPRILALHRKYQQNLKPASPVIEPQAEFRKRIPLSQILQRLEIIGIGISTGGPNALSEVFRALPPDLGVPILVVQHMPPMFTQYLAQRLSDTSDFPVSEAQDGMLLEANRAYLAPGGYHMDLYKYGNRVSVALNQQAPENSCRPSVNPTFRALASYFGPSALGVMMTGMGQDGYDGCLALHQAGGQILAQDEASSTIWGMPGAVVRAGLAEKTLPLAEIAPEIIRRVRTGR